MDEDWKKGKLKVKGSNQVFTLDQLKYDVANDLFELFIDNKVVNISGSNVVSFELSDNENVLNRRFIRAADYTIDGKQVDGYFEVLHEGEVLLFERSYAYIKKATYNQALMIGEKDDTILIKAEYYYTSGPSEVVHIKKTKDLKPLTQEGSKPKISIDRGELISFFRASVN